MSQKMHIEFRWGNILDRPPPQRYPYFGVVVGLVWSHDPESYVGGSVCTGRAPMPDRSKVMTLVL